MFTKSKVVRWLLCAAFALPLGYALLQPAQAEAARFWRRPVYRPAPIVRVAPRVAPVYPYYNPAYRWHWNGYRWVR